MLKKSPHSVEIFENLNFIPGLKNELYKINSWVDKYRMRYETGLNTNKRFIQKYDAANYLIKNQDLYIEYFANLFIETVESKKVKMDLILEYHTKYNTYNGINL